MTKSQKRNAKGRAKAKANSRRNCCSTLRSDPHAANCFQAANDVKSVEGQYKKTIALLDAVIEADDDEPTESDFWKSYRTEQQAAGSANRRHAEAEFPAAAALAQANGLLLLRHSETHYQLKKLGVWIINVYPGNQRIMAGSGPAPFLPLTPLWTLSDVVNAAVEKEKSQQ